MTTASNNSKIGNDVFEKVTPDAKREKITVSNGNILLGANEKAVYAAYFTVDEDTTVTVETGDEKPFVLMFDADILREFGSVPVGKGTHRLSAEYINRENAEKCVYIALKNDGNNGFLSLSATE